jgi:hypothetical protein
MPIRRSSAADVARLIEELSRPDALRRETAAARLAVIGPRAVTRLLAVATDSAAAAPARVAALQALEAIGDPRALGPALTLASQTDHVGLSAVAVVGAVACGAQTGPSARAFEWLAAAALDHEARTSTRLAALTALGGVSARQLAPLYAALAGDPDPALAARATRQAAGEVPPLDSGGGRALPDDPGLAAAMIREDADATPVTELRRLIEAIRVRERAVPPDARPAWTAARGQVHQALAARASRVALYDLRDTLEQAHGPLPVGFLAAAAAVGDPGCLEPLAVAWTASSAAADPWWRDHLAEAFRAIVRREKVARRHPVMRKILERHPAAAVLVAEARK